MAKRGLEASGSLQPGRVRHEEDSTLQGKKRKLHDAGQKREAIPSEDISGDVSKQERKDRRRLEKLKAEASVPPFPSADGLVDDIGEGGVLSREGDDNGRAARKVERKRLRKEERERSGELRGATDGNSTHEIRMDDAKAERKRLRKEVREKAGKQQIDLGAAEVHPMREVCEDDVNGGRKNQGKTKAGEAKSNERIVSRSSRNGISTNQGRGASDKNDLQHNFVIAKAKCYKEDSTLSAFPQSEVDTFLSSHSISIADPTTEDPLRPIMSFSQLPSDAHPQPSPFSQFKAPTPIQAASWPFLLSGRDVVGVAETGSGKTLAFGIPCVRHILPLIKMNKGGAARAVIVSPTRELAVQSFEQMQLIAKPAGLHAVCVYGGVPKESQRTDLRTAQIVVATPGRLMDLIEDGSARLENVSYLVLDEADRMLDKGFEDAIRKIVLSTSKNGEIKDSSRQTLMFTATWPPSIRELAATFMISPVKIVIGDNSDGELRANARIEQTVEVVDPRFKETRLLQLLKQHQSGKSRDDRILVFCLYKKEATRVEHSLRQKGFRVAGIHGDLSQEKRTASLEGFKKGTTPLLVATDVAARGLDIPNVKVVINVTFPLTVEDYVHRIGRTGRAGATGLSVTLFTEHDKAQSGALINVLKAAGQPVPDELLKFGTTVKRKGHEAYGAFYKESDGAKTATKIKFDD